MLADRCAHERREHEGRVGVDGILRVILREHEHAGLPFHRHPVGEHNRSGFRRREARLFGELKVLFGIAAGDQRQRRVVEIGQVVRLPFHETSAAVNREAFAFRANDLGKGVDIAIGVRVKILLDLAKSIDRPA